MQSADFNAFKQALIKVFALYDKPLTDVVLSVWWEALQPYALQEVTRALTAHVRNPDSGSYLPKPADVIKGITGGNANAAQAAWSKVDSAVRRKGPYASVAFDDAIIHRVIADMGGWIRLNAKTSEEWPFVQREFETRYRGFAIVGGVAEYPAKLIGKAEEQIQREDVKISAELQSKIAPIALIGDPVRAEMVMQGGSSGAMVSITSRLTHANDSEQSSGTRSIGQSARALSVRNEEAGSSRH